MTRDHFVKEFNRLRGIVHNTHTPASLGFLKEQSDNYNVISALRQEKENLAIYGHNSSNSEEYCKITDQITKYIANAVYLQECIHHLSIDFNIAIGNFEEFMSLAKYTIPHCEFYSYPEVFEVKSYEAYKHWKNYGVMQVGTPGGYSISLEQDFNVELVSECMPHFLEYMPLSNGTYIVEVLFLTSVYIATEYSLVLLKDKVTWGIRNKLLNSTTDLSTNLKKVLTVLKGKIE